MTNPATPDTIDQQRRRLFGAAAISLVAVPFAASAQEPAKHAGGVGTSNAFGPLKQVNLSFKVGNPARQRPVLHGRDTGTCWSGRGASAGGVSLLKLRHERQCFTRALG